MARTASVSRLLLLFSLLATWCTYRTAPLTLFATLAQNKVDLAQLKDADLEQLKLLKTQLEETLRAIRLPAPTSLMAFGKQHPVPSTVEDPKEPSQEMVRYLSGHFAGSGSVFSQTARLRVSESGPDVSNLFLFQKYFGGRVYVDTRGSGLSRPRIRWDVTGEKAFRAARMMGQSQLQKQELLVDMAEGRFGQGADDAQEEVVFQDWSEVVGFLDACMGIDLTALGKLRLWVTSSHKRVLEALAAFFLGQLGAETSILPSTSGGSGKQRRLRAGQEAARSILSASLEGGLLLKKEAAQATLGWSKDTHWELRQKLQDSKGNIRRFSRLDEAGARRALEISRLQGQLRRKAAKGADADEIQPLEEQLAKLVSTHQRLQLVEEIQRLQDHLETVQKQAAARAAA